ncbi:hypothetical protein GS498_25630 [Rhodococcus hoagii]|nr:hypothetical protein [Prescottella equi]
MTVSADRRQPRPASRRPARGGCVEVRREYTGRRVRSWIRITAHGVGKLREEVEVLRLLLDVLDSR